MIQVDGRTAHTSTRWVSTRTADSADRQYSLVYKSALIQTNHTWTPRESQIRMSVRAVVYKWQPKLIGIHAFVQRLRASSFIWIVCPD